MGLRYLSGGLSRAAQDLFQRPAGQLATLDVLRSVAVLLVIVTHTSLRWQQHVGAPNAFTEFDLVKNGWIGVDLFFVLSGYLIGKQLWSELLNTGTIHFGSFFLRRGLRIWPLYFFSIFFVIAALGKGNFPYGDWWSDAAFLSNYIPKGVLRGSWSLCTEEQFYILTPLLLLAGARLRWTLPRFRQCLVLMLIMLPVTRALIVLGCGGNLASHNPEIFRDWIYLPIHTHADGLILGLLIANSQLAENGRNRWLWRSPFTPLLAGCLFVLFRKIQPEVLGFTGISLTFGAVVCFFIARPSVANNAIFRSRLFHLLSRLSFGMYLNHGYILGDVIDVTTQMFPPGSRFPALTAIICFAISVVLSALISMFTFCLIESPFLQLRSRLLSSHRGVRTTPAFPVTSGTALQAAA